MCMKLQFKQLHPDAKLPSYGHSTDAGMDLYTLEQLIFKPGEQKIIPIGIAINLPKGYAALVWDKSSIGISRGIKSLGGVFDSGYTGEMIISLVNVSHQTQVIEKGAKCAQLLIQKVESCDIEWTDTLTESSRGDGGFGSTGNF